MLFTGIKLLTNINSIVQQRADLESNRMTLSSLLEDLRRKLRRRVEECHLEKKDKMRVIQGVVTKTNPPEHFFNTCSMADLPNVVSRSVARNAPSRRKRQAELDIIRLRKELSATKSCVASLRIPPGPLRKQCSKFA
ncbi:Peptidase S9A/B/C family catalytic domain protein [Operophtera brumata]|uniref:Peptidase S9A/B/C family catalytic domain protein n=1 Tax=Operophtera brumata TaxID=104452 RepID=A0A0L7L0G8_OPEBR|nr:Peptidase S9A/B/C family catalytic domain protein [Operophtera brumata]